MKIFSALFIVVLFPIIAIFAFLQWMECAAMAQVVTAEKRTIATEKLTEYLGALNKGTETKTKGMTLAEGVFCQVHTYRGPLGEGKLVKLFVNDGRTNKLVKVVDLGPENRGKDY